MATQTQDALTVPTTTRETPPGTRPPRTWGSVLRYIGIAVALVYAFVGDTLLTWTVVDTVVRLAPTAIGRTELVGTAERARTALELHAAGIEDASRFEWFEPPPADSLGDADGLLARLGAIDGHGALTKLERVRLPVDLLVQEVLLAAARETEPVAQVASIEDHVKNAAPAEPVPELTPEVGPEPEPDLVPDSPDIAALEAAGRAPPPAPLLALVAPM